MNIEALHEIPCLQSNMFPISISVCNFNKHGNVFPNHWHDHIEFLYIINGKGIIECNSIPYNVKPGDLVVVNSRELHCGYSLSDFFMYYCIIVDPVLLQSSNADACNIKYINPITRNLLIFNNLISDDKEILEYINRILSEYDMQKIGYELSIKSDIYKTLVLLMRNHVRNTVDKNNYELRKKELERLRPVLEYIENNYSKQINGLELSKLCNISRYHFCHQFKEITGKTVTDYINNIRINKAVELLFSTSMNITEISLATGFNDINYFIRIFKKLREMPPTAFRSKYSQG